MNDNPFSIIFGKNPIVTIERPIEKNEIINAFSNSRINQQIYLITSIRRSGKTVLMTEISKHFKNDNNWIVIELNNEMDMQESMLAKLNSQVGNLLKSINMNLSFFNIVTIGANLENKITDKETAIIKVLEHLKQQGKRVLITVDEAISNTNMKVFASTFQILVRNDLPVFLLMTGLYENIKNLQDEKNLTFLYRAPKITLGPLNLSSIANKYKAVFNLSDEDGMKMANLTEGYAFAFQALGFLTYRHNGNYKEALDDYKLYLEEYSYQKIWSELSKTDKNVLYGLAKCGSENVKEIMEKCKLDANHFNPYRKRLLDKGVLVSRTRGQLEFALPLFKQFVLDNYFFENETY